MASFTVDIKPEIDWSDVDKKIEELKIFMKEYDEWEKRSRDIDFVIGEVVDYTPACCRGCCNNTGPNRVCWCTLPSIYTITC